MPAVDDKRLEGLVHAPEFPQQLDWLNTGHKLSLKNFRGKMVLLDFWTFCCINCMHVIPDLKKLEAKYSDSLVVIGVHSAKFFNEKDTDSIRQAIMRYEIKHPVINDKDMEVWQQYGVQAWPTLVLINPNGRIIGMHSGEDIFDLFDGMIGQAVSYFEKKGELKRGPLNLKLEEDHRPNTLLSFPGKIRADAERGQLYISDSNHNRILITDLNGKVLEILGDGMEGWKDASFEEAEFHHPQGVFRQDDILYIADTENHLIRAADLKTRQVKTLLGTGKKARQIGVSGVGTQIDLNSPWDLLAYQGKLYIAMAGPHQIYAADLKTLQTEPYAGSGREARIDGPLKQAALAQPSGIATNGLRLFFADSEVSSIRAADLDPNGKVETLIGDDLFEFGDIDGDISSARLQHALGVAFDPADNMLYVADTYNSKIKIVNPYKKTSETLAGTGKHGYKDGIFKEAQFFEPGGLAILGDKIFVADTNNHQIRVIDRRTGQVSTLEISGLDRIARQTMNPFMGRKIEIPRKTLKAGKGSISVSFSLPKGYKFNEDAPFHLEWKSQNRTVLNFTGESSQLDKPRVSFPFEIPVQAEEGADDFNLEAVVYYCREDSKICLFDHLRAHVPVEVKKEGPSKISLEVDILPKS